MTLYALYDPKPGRHTLPAAVPEKFSAFAMLLPPLFFLVHGLWLELVAWALAVVALVLGTRVIGAEAAFWLYVVGAVWIGFAAPGFRRHALLSRGWRQRGQRIAMSADLAQLEALR